MSERARGTGGSSAASTLEGESPASLEDHGVDALEEPQAARWPRLTPEQQELAAKHVGLVGVHLRSRVPTPRQPMRYREYDDLFQQGCVALARAAARYRPDRDGPFAAYALPRIRGAVHNALHDLFTVVHVPARAIQQAREQPGSAVRPPPHHVQDLTDEIARGLILKHAGHRETESIRHAIRRRFEAAVRRSLEQMRRRVWRYRNPCKIMERIARERLLIHDERFRTPLRQIAREAGVSSGRACDYEKNLLNAIVDGLKQDSQLQALLEMAREDKAGWDGIVDASRRQRLMQVEMAEFEARFTAMEPPARAQMVYSLIERSSQSVSEVARNLYRLSLTADDDGRRTVA